MNIDFVAGHRYFTEYAKTHFEKQRRLNLATLKRQLNRLKEECEEKPLGEIEKEAPVKQEGGE
jgi:ribosome-interacting GTPase 1